MNDNANSRRPDAAFADISNVLQQIFQRGLGLICAPGLLSRLAQARDHSEFGAALQELLTRLRAELDNSIQQWRDQVARLQQPDGFLGLLQTQLAQLNPAALGAFATSGFPNHGAALPPLGMFQDKIRQLEAGSAAMLGLQTAVDDFAKQLRRIGEGALAELAAALRQDSERELGLRDLYQIWLVANETAYERVLGSEDYAASLGRLINASAELARLTQTAVDDMLEALKLPSARERTAMLWRLHQMRREQRMTREAARETHSLRQELAELRAELEQLRRAAKPAARRARSPRRREAGHAD